MLDPAYMPETPSFPDRVLFAIGGAIAGLLLGLGLAITIDVLDPTMKDAEGVAAAFTRPGARGDPLRQAAGPGSARGAADRRGRPRDYKRKGPAVVRSKREPQERGGAQVIDPISVKLVEGVPQPATGQPLQQAVLGSGHYLAEEFRFLASKVAGLAKERFTTIGVVSTGPSEGKTTVALGLTAALSRISDQRSLLLEADLRQPSIERYLGLPRTAGVAEFLAGRSENVIVRTISPPDFAIVGAGRERLGEAGAPGLRSHGGAHRGVPALVRLRGRRLPAARPGRRRRFAPGHDRRLPAGDPRAPLAQGGDRAGDVAAQEGPGARHRVQRPARDPAASGTPTATAIARSTTATWGIGER